MKKATLQDVAALAGLSTGTVSKYINGKPVSPKNQEKIRAAINTLEFTPSPLARSFASGKSYTILLYLVVEEPIVDSTWQHELPIIHGITDMLRGSKYSLKIEIASVQEEEENVHKLDAYCRSQYVDGIILLSPWEVNIKLVLSLDYHYFPYVIIGGSSSGSDHACIDFDNEKPVYDIVMDMYRRGCRRFGMICGFMNQRHTVLRRQGFLNALEHLNIPLRDNSIRYGDYSLHSGYECAMDLLSDAEVPDAILCGNDYIAAGAIRAVHEKNMKIPQDILISGFDNTIVSEATNPTITTVSAPAYEMGTIAAQMLLARLHDPDFTIPNHQLQCEIIHRASTDRD